MFMWIYWISMESLRQQYSSYSQDKQWVFPSNLLITEIDLGVPEGTASWSRNLFPDWQSNPGWDGESIESYPPDHKGQQIEAEPLFLSSLRKNSTKGLPWWLSGKESICNAGDARDLGSIPGLGRIPGGGNGNSLQCSCLGNSMDSRAWQATVNGVVKISYKGNSFPDYLWPIIWLMSIFDLTQGLPWCACVSYSQYGFQHKGFWKVGRP